MTTSEKVAYLKGLAEGYGIDTATKEGKLLSTVLDILEDLAVDVSDLGSEVLELGEGLDAVSDDLSDVEDVLFGEEDDEDEEDEDDYDECGDCDECGPVFYEVTCPNCGETITFDEDVLARGSIDCPGCGETMEFDREDDESEED